jgi:hypothetical protein
VLDEQPGHRPLWHLGQVDGGEWVSVTTGPWTVVTTIVGVGSSVRYDDAGVFGRRVRTHFLRDLAQARPRSCAARDVTVPLASEDRTPSATLTVMASASPFPSDRRGWSGTLESRR